jgi:hypothetical protein
MAGELLRAELGTFDLFGDMIRGLGVLLYDAHDVFSDLVILHGVLKDVFVSSLH